MIDEEKDQTVFVFSTSIALSAFLAQIFLNPEKRNPQQWDLQGLPHSQRQDSVDLKNGRYSCLTVFEI